MRQDPHRRQETLEKISSRLYSVLSTFGIWDLTKLSQMFPSDEFWKSVAFVLIGAMIAMLTLKLRESEAKEQCKRPQEHDERSG